MEARAAVSVKFFQNKESMMVGQKVAAIPDQPKMTNQKIVLSGDTIATIKAIARAAILGIGGDEIIHSITDIMYAKAPYTVIQRAVHVHPTVSELIPTMLGELKPLE